MRARGWIELDGGGASSTCAAIVDESAGYHARHTAWRWSAGVGTLASGEPVAWNLVDGIHDAPEASERTVWVAGEPREVAPVGSTASTASPACASRPRPLARGARTSSCMRSDYEQPFGTFTGELPGAGPLAEGWGVMERHDVRW